MSRETALIISIFGLVFSLIALFIALANLLT